jgi:hypothetical protein
MGIQAGAAKPPTGFGVGVYGLATLDGFGVFGESGEQGSGVFGITRSTGGTGVAGNALSSGGVAVFGFATPSEPDTKAGEFQGQVLVSGDAFVEGNLTVTGITSHGVRFPDGSNHKLHNVESPESWFEDFGTGRFVNGQAEIQLDPDFASVVNSDLYHVFLTEYDDNNALYVTGRTSAGFGVRAKSSRTATGIFSYRVVAKRKDVTGPRFERVAIPPKRSPPQIREL